MSEYIECRHCDSPQCDGCNLNTLAKMLHGGKFDCLMDNKHSIKPTADVVEVRHGEWKPCFEDWRKQIEGDECSVCGFQHYGTTIRDYHYCPNCGAKMDGKEVTNNG